MCSGYGMKVWLVEFFSPGHRQLLCCALKSTSKGKMWEEERRRCDNADWMAAMKGNCVCWSSGCIHSADSVAKHFFKGSKLNKTGMDLPDLH